MTSLEQLQERASKLIGHIELNECRLFGMNVQHHAFPTEGNIGFGGTTINMQTTPSPEDAEVRTVAYVMTIGTPVLEERGEGEPPTTLIDINLSYGTLYVISDGAESFSDDELTAFGNLIATMTMWPFIRAFVSRTLQEMGLQGNLLLPMLTPFEIAEAVGHGLVLDTDEAPQSAAPQG